MNELKIETQESVKQEPASKAGHCAQSIEQEVENMSLEELLHELNEKIN